MFGNNNNDIKKRIKDLELYIKGNCNDIFLNKFQPRVLGLEDKFQDQIKKLNESLYGTSVTLGLIKEVEKLKAIVAEIADTVHKDNDK